MKEDLTKSLYTVPRDAIPKAFWNRIFILGLMVLFISCDQKKKLLDQKEYEGPLSSLDSINTLLSDSGRVVMHMKAARQNNFENGDQEWPQGLFLESFDKTGNVISLFEADYVFYEDKSKLYRAEGNILVTSHETGDKLNTEELYWNPERKIFYTDKFVTINTEGEVHTGEGLEAQQDFSSYRILKPRGTFTLEDDPVHANMESERAIE